MSYILLLSLWHLKVTLALLVLLIGFTVNYQFKTKRTIAKIFLALYGVNAFVALIIMMLFIKGYMREQYFSKDDTQET
jgi:hypothetical protein